MNIVNVGYDSTNYYVLADSQPCLLIDVGFPSTLPKLQHQCKRSGIALENIKHLLATHYHPDHAGLAQELKNIGIKLIVMENQRVAIPALKSQLKPQNHYVEINLKDNIDLSLSGSRAFLAKLGIRGEIISTPGHSDDSVTLILDEIAAFTGDLGHPLLLTDAPNDITKTSWDTIRSFGVKKVYPGHGPVWELSEYS